MTAPFFSRHPELQRWLQEFLGISSGAAGGSPPIANSASSPPPAATPVHPSLGNGAHHRDQTPAHPPHPYSLLSSQGMCILYSVLLIKILFHIEKFNSTVVR